MGDSEAKPLPEQTLRIPIVLRSLRVHPQIPEPARAIPSLVAACAGVSLHEATRLIHAGCVRANGRPVSQTHLRMQVGDLVEVDHIPAPVRVPKGKTAHHPPEVLFEDRYLLIVNKPCHLLTVPTPHREKNTLLSAMTKHVQKGNPKGQAYCVHRLDRGVSGLLVMAKELDVAMQIRDQFAARKPQRVYMAIVAGHLEQPQGTIESYLATDEQLNRYSVGEGEEGELAITHYKTVLPMKNATLVEVQLETGRRNQIRVHMAEMGNPILGDPRYGSDVHHSAWPFRRLALHAESLGFDHPVTDKPLSFRTSWPEEFREFKRKATLR